ncbi:MAG: hypothetical protein ABI220_02350 [Candidatus Saccharimonadales bacterium]
MSSVVIAFMLAAGVGTWVYSKMSRRTGTGNTGPALMVSIIAGVGVFIVGLTVISKVMSS